MRLKSVLFHELRFQLHLAETVDFAIDVVIAFDQADVLHFGADLQHGRATFHLQIFYHGDAVAVGQQVTVSIFDDQLIAVVRRLSIVPLVRAFRADEHAVVFIGVFGIALWAMGQ